MLAQAKETAPLLIERVASTPQEEKTEFPLSELLRFPHLRKQAGKRGFAQVSAQGIQAVNDRMRMALAQDVSLWRFRVYVKNLHVLQVFNMQRSTGHRSGWYNVKNFHMPQVINIGGCDDYSTALSRQADRVPK